MNWWPASADYKEAIQNPAHCFCDAELRAGRVLMDARRGSPTLWSGNFAVVFKMQGTAPNEKWAIKCFTRNVSDLQTRYQLISEHLTKHKTVLPFTIDVEFHQQGINVKGQWFPIVKMRWVEGFTLNTFVEDRLDQPKTLQTVANILAVRVAEQLKRSQVAHGDLQHGNIILVPKDEKTVSVKLVDYDGMFVPELALNCPNERGHANYQHPERLRDGTYNENVDRFPLMVIYSALHCLAKCGPTLWEKYNNEENLLFREADFEKPGDSALLHELWNHSSSSIRSYAGKLILISERPLNRVPTIREFLGLHNKIQLTEMEEERVSYILSKPKSLFSVNTSPNAQLNDPNVSPIPFVLPAPVSVTPKPRPNALDVGEDFEIDVEQVFDDDEFLDEEEDEEEEEFDDEEDDDDDNDAQLRDDNRALARIVVDRPLSGIAIASMAVGLVSVLFGTVGTCCFPTMGAWIALICGVGSVILSAIGKVPGSEGIANTGMILGSVGAACAIFYGAVLLAINSGATR